MQPLKTPLPIDVTEEGISIEFNDVQSSNIYSLNKLIEDGIEIVFNDLHL